MPTIEEQRRLMDQTAQQISQAQGRLRATPVLPQQQPVTGRPRRLTTGQQQQQQLRQQQANQNAYNRFAQEQEIARLEQERQAQQAELEALQSRQSALDLTEGRSQQIMQDPYMVGALEEIQGRQGPITDEVRAAMLSQQSDMSGIAAERQMEALREQAARLGMSMGGPSYGAMAREIEADRIGQNQAAARDVMVQQAMQNYGARDRALQMLMGGRGQQYGLSAGPAAQAAGYYASDVREDPRNVSRTVPVSTAPLSRADETIRLLREYAGR